MLGPYGQTSMQNPGLYTQPQQPAQQPKRRPAYLGDPALNKPTEPVYNERPGGSNAMLNQPASPSAVAPSVTEQGRTPNWYNDPSTIETPQGWDFSTPGVGEQYFNYALDQAQNRQLPTNNAQGAYQNYMSSLPADLNPYYDFQRQQLTNNMNTQLGARGAYGSSVGLGQLSLGLAGINADQAKAEAEYGLNRATLGGNLASAADQSSRANSQNSLDYMNALGSLAGQAQEERRQRGRDYMSDVMGMTGLATGTMQQGYNDLLGDDQNLFANQEGLFTGQGIVNQQNAANQAQRTKDDTAAILAIASMF